MAAMRPPAMPISVSSCSAPMRRAFLRMRSMTVFPPEAALRSQCGPVIAEIGAHQRRVPGNFARAARMLDRTGLQHIGPIGDRQRERRHLVDEQDRRPLPAQLRQEIIEDFQKFRRQAERRLVEHENFRASHKTAGNGEHLLLTAGNEAGALVAARLERSKALGQRFDPARAKNEAAPSFPRRSAISTLSMTDRLSNSRLV